MADLVEITDPDDPRLADYRDLRDVELRKTLEAEHGLFLAEGEKVVRRAVEAGYDARSFLMAPRWLVGLDDVLARSDGPCYVLSEALIERVTGFHVHRGASSTASIKVGMGAVFTTPWTRLPDWYDALPDLSRRGFTTVALTLADDSTPIEAAVAGVGRLALVLGSEGHGLSARWEASADRRAIIPMRAGIDSLNVAAATAVACYAAARR